MHGLVEREAQDLDVEVDGVAGEVALRHVTVTNLFGVIVLAKLAS